MTRVEGSGSGAKGAWRGGEADGREVPAVAGEAAAGGAVSGRFGMGAVDGRSRVSLMEGG